MTRKEKKNLSRVKLRLAETRLSGTDRRRRPPFFLLFSKFVCLVIDGKMEKRKTGLGESSGRRAAGLETRVKNMQ